MKVNVAWKPKKRKKKKGKALSFRMYELFTQRKALSEIPAGLQRREWIKKRWKLKYFTSNGLPSFRRLRSESQRRPIKEEKEEKKPSNDLVSLSNRLWMNQSDASDQQTGSGCVLSKRRRLQNSTMCWRASRESKLLLHHWVMRMFFFFIFHFYFIYLFQCFYHSSKLLTISSLICAPKTHKGYLWI